MKRLFDLYIAVDWSAKNTPSPAKPSKDAIWIGIKEALNSTRTEQYFRTRHEAMDFLKQLLISCVPDRKRVLVGFDLDFGFPAGFVDSLNIEGNDPKWMRLWKKLSSEVQDNQDNSNNRFEVASVLNGICMPPGEKGPLWGHPIKQKYKYLHYKSPKYPFVTSSGQTLRKFRWTEMRESKAQPSWKLIGSASVGGQTIMGIPALYKLRFDIVLAPHSAIWPFDTGFRPPIRKEGTPFILFTEIWPGILRDRLDSSISIKDQAQVRATVNWMEEIDENQEILTILSVPSGLSQEAQLDCVNEEGWVLGSGYYR